MRYILGLDIGTTSVGWSALALDATDEPFKILDLGSRIFPAAENPKNGSSLAEPCREARGARRRLRRRRFRMERIRHLFIRKGLLSKEEMDNLFNASADVYAIRAAGLERKLENDEWARILYHIAKHRGFKSNRRNPGKDADEGKVLEAVNANKAILANYRSVGDMLCNDDKFAEAKRNKNGEYKFCVGRDMLSDEISILFSKQREFGNQHAEEAFEEEFVEIFASQRSFDDGPDRNQGSRFAGDQIAKMFGLCSLEPKEKRAPKASYSFMRFALLQKINHIRLKKSGEERPLTTEERAVIEALAWKTANFSYGAIRKELNLPDDVRFNDLYYRYGQNIAETEKKRLPFTVPYHEIRKALDKVAKNRIAELSHEELDIIGYAFTAHKNDEKIEAMLRKNGIGESDIKALMDAGLSFRGTGHISVAACKKLIPFLEQGMTYDKACAAAGYDVFGQNEEKHKLLVFNEIKELSEVTNPVVRRSISQTIKVINAIVRRYGSPVAVHVELARELGRSFADRKKAEKSMDENAKANEILKAKCKEYGIANPKGQDIIKLKLYEEQGGVCAYTQRPMRIEAVLKEPGYAEVDHILPWSRSMDDSYANKVLVLAKGNRDKGNRTPLEYLPDERKGSFKTWVKNQKSLGPRKKENLLMEDFSKREEGWKTKSLNDTRYASRVVFNVLQNHLLFADWADKNRKQHVFSANGMVTNYIRKRFGIAKIREDGDAHHAVDAAIVATVTPGIVRRLTEYARKKEAPSFEDFLSKHIPEPWPKFRQELEARACNHPKELIESLRLPTYMPNEIDALTPMFVSRAPKGRISGAAHEATVFSPKEGTKMKKTALSNLVVETVEGKRHIKGFQVTSRNEALHEALLARLAEFGDKAEKAFAEPFYAPTESGNGPQVKTVKLVVSDKPDVKVYQGHGVAKNDSLVRVDIFRIKEGKDAGFYSVPIYVRDTIEQELPSLAVYGKTRETWKPMAEEDFLFSLSQNDVVFISAEKGITIEPKNKKGEKEKTKEGFFYFKALDISTGVIAIETHDGAMKGRTTIRNLLRFEKYVVGVLGEGPYPVGKERRIHFAKKTGMKKNKK